MFVLSLIASLSGMREAAANPTELTVGLYPYVPRLAQFQIAIQTEWNKVRPDIALKFLSTEEWDGGYDLDPPDNADVYVFDAIFLDYFRSQNWLEPIQAKEIKHLDDFVDYAIDGVRIDQKYYAMKNTIKADARADDPCGCDRLAIEQILNNSVAPPICEATCADYGGWNGRWTNEYPAAQAGSVCGCNACSLF